MKNGILMINPELVSTHLYTHTHSWWPTSSLSRQIANVWIDDDTFSDTELACSSTAQRHWPFYCVNIVALSGSLFRTDWLFTRMKERSALWRTFYKQARGGLCNWMLKRPFATGRGIWLPVQSRAKQSRTEK